MKFGTCNEYFENWPLEQVFDYAAELGYDGVEVAPFTLAPSVDEISDSKRREIRAAAAAAGVDIIGLHWLLISPEGLYTNHADDDIRHRTRDYFKSLIRFCGDLGGKVMIIGSPKQRNLLPGVSFEQAWELARQTFAPSIKMAEDKAVTICFEPLAPSETNFVNTAEKGIEFIQQFNSEAFKIILDVKAMCSDLKPIPDIIRDSHPNFAYFHANDANLKGPGFGEIDFKPIFGTLKEVGYDGFVSVEVFDFEEGPETIARESLRYIKETSA